MSVQLAGKVLQHAKAGTVMQNLRETGWAQPHLQPQDATGLQGVYGKTSAFPPWVMTGIGLSYSLLSLYCSAFKGWAMNSCIPILQVKNNCVWGNVSF